MVVVTMLEARVSPDRAGELIEEHKKLGEPPPMVVESFLLNEPDTDLWRLVTLVTSRAELDEVRERMRVAGEVPPGVRVFRAVGAEPSLTIFEVVTHYVSGDGGRGDPNRPAGFRLERIG